ncbi:MAG: PAC2 family protein [Nitrospirota bacterium]|nr:PAC2 family protein [Nitrospirota bacterium]
MKKQDKVISSSLSENLFLLVGWNRDTGKIAPEVLNFLNVTFASQKFSTIDPLGFFSFEGVAVYENCIQFPESAFFSCQRKDLIFFKSDQPEHEQYRFLNIMLETASQIGQINELYTINGMVSQISHTDPRRMFAVFNRPELHDMLQTYELEGLTWEGPPAISSFLLWLAGKKEIPGLSLWIEVPFYLAAVEDFQAIKLALSFFDQRFNLNLDLSELNSKIIKQNEKIEQLRIKNKELDKYLGLLESGLGLKDEIKIKLVRDIYMYLKKDT